MPNPRNRKQPNIADHGAGLQNRPLPKAGHRIGTDFARRASVDPAIVERAYWLETMINHIPDYIYAKDCDGRFIMANYATIRDNGLSCLEDIVGKTDFDLHGEESVSVVAQAEREVMETGIPMIGVEERALSQHTSIGWVSTSRMPLRDKTGALIGTVGISSDITERKLAEQLLLGQTKLLEMVAQSLALEDVFSALIVLMEEQMPGVRCSILLLSPDGKQLFNGLSPNLDPDYVKAINGVFIGPCVGSCATAAWRGEKVVVSDIATDPLWENHRELAARFGLRSCWSTPIKCHEGRVLGTFALYSGMVAEPTRSQADLTALAAHIAGIAIERKRSEERIHFMAHHDALTGLPNRVMFDAHVATALDMARERSTGIALAFFDLDNFKLINDSLGHGAGDDLLKVVARRAEGHLKPGDMVARLGGDEFIVLLNGAAAGADGLMVRLRALRTDVSRPVTLLGRTLQVTSSMGVAAFPDHGQTADVLLANADAAMYSAKKRGRDNLQIFDAEMAASSNAKLQRHEELRQAITGNQFFLQYQPQFDLETGRIFAVEALIRWNHPVRGLVSPCEFIPLAEQTGLIVQIGEWVLRTACFQNKAWQDAGLPPVVVSVNVSARQFSEADWVARIGEILDESGLDPRYLELELTESLIMQDVAGAIARMHEVEALGVHLAIDDFGTGYSSLSALKSFPVTRLKIDRSFVQDIPQDADDMAITGAIVSLAQKLGLRVIAEGVETQAQVDFLRSCGCTEIQGYFFSRPLLPEALAALMVDIEA